MAKYTYLPTYPTFENLKEAFTCFILCDVIFSSKVCFGDMSLGMLSVGRISDFFECYIKISQSLNYFGIFITDKEESVSHLSPGILPKKQYDQSSNSTCVVFFLKKCTPHLLFWCDTMKLTFHGLQYTAMLFEFCWTRSYDDILGLSWSVPKIPSHPKNSCFFINVWCSLLWFIVTQFLSFWCVYYLS